MQRAAAKKDIHYYPSRRKAGAVVLVEWYKKMQNKYRANEYDDAGTSAKAGKAKAIPALQKNLDMLSAR